MWRYVARRLLAMIPVAILVTLITAALIRLVPGDVLLAQIAQGGFVDPADLDRIRHQIGLDRPFHVQYFEWLWGAVRGDFGISLASYRSARDEILRTLPLTVELAIIANFVATLVAIPIGLYSALRQDTVGDYVSRVIAILGIAAPNFWLATLFIVFGAVWFGYFPPLKYQGLFESPWGNFKSLFWPGVILGMGLTTTAMRMIRSSTLEVIRQDYVRTARAKGLSEGMIIWRHVLKNAFIPVITIVGTRLAFQLGGSVIIESIFNLPGLGRLTLLSITQRDYVQLQANVLVISLLVLMMNFLVDLSYAWFDPRIKYS
ncbi:MAG: ABC transporter permease [Chloroflexi bacterium]|nr:ABC transporter permease [Chloroflexota bacterium]